MVWIMLYMILHAVIIAVRSAEHSHGPFDFGLTSGSSYRVIHADAAITFNEAMHLCGAGGLVIFPTAVEQYDIFGVLNLLASTEPDLGSTGYWIGAAGVTEGGKKELFWVHPKSVTAESSGLELVKSYKFNGDQTQIDVQYSESGIIIYHNTNTSFTFETMSTNDVTNYICEHQSESQPNFIQWTVWSGWSDNECQSSSVNFTQRTSSCIGYNCERAVNKYQYIKKVCCDNPIDVYTVQDAVISPQYYYGSGLERAVAGDKIIVKCQPGYVHASTRLKDSSHMCIQTASTFTWSPTIPERCVPVDCGEPPPGVHASQPEYTKTTYNSIATYACQTGFKEVNSGNHLIILRCEEEDMWQGPSGETDLKSACVSVYSEPLIDWLYNSKTRNCYQLRHLPSTWLEALSHCDGDLLNVMNAEELEFINTHILLAQNERTIIWLSSRKRKAERIYQWNLNNDTTVRVIDYNNYKPGYSPDTGVTLRDFCLTANYSEGDWHWLSHQCDLKFEFICKTTSQLTDGGWGSWTEWSVCDRELARRRSRICDDPTPFCGGGSCVGDDVQTSRCCTYPGEHEHSRVIDIGDNSSLYRIAGDRVKYQCHTGYTISGTRNRTVDIICQLTGTWSPPSPDCARITCPSPPSGIHSHFTRSNVMHRYEDQITYTCDTGFVLRFNSTLNNITKTVMCNSDGEWDQPPPACTAISCGDPLPTLSNQEMTERNIDYNFMRHISEVSHSSSSVDSTNLNLFRDKYQFSCIYGYQTNFREDYNISCGYDGRWISTSPNNAATDYEARYHPEKCYLIQCNQPVPQPINNSKWVSDLPPGAIGTYGDVSKFECFEGYQIESNSSDSVITKYELECGPNNAWTNEYTPKYCKKQTCEQPGHGENVERISGTLEYLTSVEYVCLTGFLSGGNNTRRKITCDLHDQNSELVVWNDTALHCKSVVCPQPKQGANADMETIQSNASLPYSFKTVVRYTCHPNHVLAGGGGEYYTIICSSHSGWNGTVPHCVFASMWEAFEVFYRKPYAVEARWIMTDKYEGVTITFDIEYNGVREEFANQTNIPGGLIHSGNKTVLSRRAGIKEAFLYTRPDYVYTFKIHGWTTVTMRNWVGEPKKLIMGGGPPFVGSVQLFNLPRITTPEMLLKPYRARPVLSQTQEKSKNRLKATFHSRMFSEENGTIYGFAVIVEEVHPWHRDESIYLQQHYSGPRPAKLATWYQVSKTSNRYELWVPYFVTPICNILNSSLDCSRVEGNRPDTVPRPDVSPLFSIHSSFKPNNEKQLEVEFIIGALDCDRSLGSKADADWVCNGPLRMNRIFCVKLRAYNTYGYSDSNCSNVVAVSAQLEFDRRLIWPTVLSVIPFAIFIAIVCFMHGRDWAGYEPLIEVDPNRENTPPEVYTSYFKSRKQINKTRRPATYSGIN